jgi:long-chain acyl-CoA synthetase
LATVRADTLPPEDPAGLVVQARARPQHAALIEGERRRTYAELDDRARRVARALADRGVQPGDRVAVMLPNGFEWFEAIHGVGRLGAIAVPVNIHFKADEASHVVRDSGATAVIVDSELIGALDGVPDVARLVVGRDYEDALADVAGADDVELGGPDADGWPTTMLYTSGTTGRPKGVAIGEHDFRRTAKGFVGMAAPFGFGPDDVHLLVGPAYHAGPAVWAQVHLAVGGTIVIMPSWDAEEFLELVERHGVTTTHMVPANFIRLLDLPDDVRQRYDLSSLRHVWHAAAPCPVPVKEQIMAWFPEDSIWEYYGASEGGGTSISPQEWLARRGSVGRPYPGHEFQIRNEAGEVLAPGETGVIWVRSQFTSFRYHNDDEKTAQTFDDEGLFSVGDMGYLDEEGYLFITDRKSDMVISGGVNIYPREVENCLYEHPGVTDCAVFGVPDDRWGEVLLAVVQPSAGGKLTEDDVVSWCREHLADYKRPRHVELVDELPRDPNGKVVKRRLREEWLARFSALD